MLSIDARGAVLSAVVDAEAALVAVVDAVRAGALRGCSQPELTGLIGSLRGLAARVEAVTLTVVGEVDARGSHAEEGLLTTAAWLRARARMDPSDAAATVSTARALRSGGLEETAAALARGHIDPAQARAICRGIADAPAGAVELIEPEALAVAREADPRAVATLMRRFQHALDPDDADERAMRRFERRGLSYAPTMDGSLAGSFLADEVSASLIATAVDTASPLVAGDKRTAAQRRLDGLAEICRGFLTSPGAPHSGGPRARVIVTVDAGTLAGPGERGSPGATLSWVGLVTGSTARRLACDAEVSNVVLAAGGEVVATGRERRFFSTAQRAAMIARDGDRCAGPWCDRPAAWADGHHLTPWGRGGSTTVENGMLVCSRHHTLLHEGRWSAQRLPDGRYVWRHLDGRTLGPEQHPSGHNRPRARGEPDP